MNFNSPVFLFFLLTVYGLHLALPAGWWRLEKAILLAASLLFYAWARPIYVVLLLASTAIDFQAGRILARPGFRRRRLALAASLIGNLGILGFFKYGGFALENGQRFAVWIGFEPDPIVWSIFLPIGISFYTFQSMSYTIDIFRRRLDPFPRFFDFALYVSLFPQLVAGPIVRATEFRGQLASKRPFRWPRFSWGVFLIILGFFHKAVLADNIAPLASGLFDRPSLDGVSFASAWLGSYAFAAQIYCDFAGYSWIAIGVATLFGFRFPPNFRTPYLAASFSEFWRRWHMTLSRYLRDYLYIPLGGNRGGRLRTARNLFLTMTLGGLWHGASWNFVLWGVGHGLYLVGERGLHSLVGVRWRRLPHRLTRPLQTLLVFHGVCFAWVFFRSADLSRSIEIAGAMFSNLHLDGVAWHPAHPFLLLTAAIHFLPVTGGLASTPGRRRRWGFWTYLVATGFMLFSLLRMRGDASAFIYFQF